MKQIAEVLEKINQKAQRRNKLAVGGMRTLQHIVNNAVKKNVVINRLVHKYAHNLYDACFCVTLSSGKQKQIQ